MLSFSHVDRKTIQDLWCRGYVIPEALHPLRTGVKDTKSHILVMCEVSSMPDFSLSKRYDSPYWYVSFKNPYTQKYGTKKSTGSTSKTEATKIAYQMLFDGKGNAVKSVIDALRTMELTAKDAQDIIDVLESKDLISTVIAKSDAGARDFVGYLEEFWDYDRSPYVKEKLHKNHSIHRSYVKSSRNCVELYWKPFFKNRPIGTLNKNDLNSFMDSLGSTISGARKNNIVKVGTIALKWAYNNHIIPADITKGIVWFSKKSQERVIFTPEQAAQIFSHPWPHETSRLANILAMTTGLRAGEIMALRKKDLGEDCVYISHSWNQVDKQKTTKNNENRIAYILFPEIREGLVKLAENNPYGEGMDGYVFWASIPGKPRENTAWLQDLRQVASELGFANINDITFHGWRHFFTTYLYSELDEKILQKATGHKTIEMLRHYANHDRSADASAIQGAIKRVFEPILRVV